MLHTQTTNAVSNRSSFEVVGVCFPITKVNIPPKPALKTDRLFLIQTSSLAIKAIVLGSRDKAYILVNSNDGCVEHLHIVVTCIGCGGNAVIPQVRLLPSIEAGFIWPIPVRKIVRRRS